MPGEQGAVLGIDVGWSTVRRSSAACLLSWSEVTIRVDLRRFTALASDRAHALRELIAGRRDLTVAIDGPLRGDLGVIGRYRGAERALTRGFARRIGKPGQSSSPNGQALNRQANAVAADLLAWGCAAEAGHGHGIHGKAIVEAFPTGFLGVLIDEGGIPPKPRHRARSDIYFERLAADRATGLEALLAALLPGRQLAHRLAGITNHDERAAVVCAVTALCVRIGRYTAVGDADGHIILPPTAAPGRPGMCDWAVACLRVNGILC
jgi:hypothetical protein